MTSRSIRWLAPLIGLFLLGAALWVLHHELRHFHYHEMVGHLRSISFSRLAVAVLLVAASYGTLTLYDLMALRYAGRQLPFRRTALASFIGYTFAHNIGMAFLSGGGVRYRLYSAWGLSGVEIARVVVFTWGTLWLGFLALAGVLFVLDPGSLSHLRFVPFGLRPLGMVFLALLAGYLALVVVRRAPFRFRSWELRLPGPGMAAAQIGVSVLDWLFAAAVLLPLLGSVAHVSVLHVVAVFLFAQVAGMISQVPGGLGVFESVMVTLLAPVLPTGPVVAALLVYRLLYYLLPFGVASLLLGFHELRSAKVGLPSWVTATVPHVLGASTFVAGVVLLVSGSTPASGERIAWLRRLLPLPVIEASHFISSLVGAALLVLARALQRRVDLAWALTCLLLAAGVVVSLLKGLDYEEACILGVMLAALLPCRREFRRRSALREMSPSFAWVMAVLMVAVACVGLGLFAFRHVEYSHDLWWRFAYESDAPRTLRAGVGVAVLLLCVGLARLVAAGPGPRPVGGAALLATAGRIAAACPRTSAYLALTGDKSFVFSDAGEGFVMYGVQGRSWVALGDPVGAGREELARSFHELADRHGGWTAFYQVDGGALGLYVDLGLTLLKLGEEARVPLGTFELEGRAHKSLRRSVRRIDEAGYVFRIVPEVDVPALMPELHRVSDAWLGTRHLTEKGFSLGFFSEPYLSRFPAAVLEKEGRVAAFGNVWPGGGKEELSIDLMRHDLREEPGLMDCLFAKLMLWGKANGYRWFNLGMAPLSGMPEGALAPLWGRLGAFVFRHGGSFYNFEGLRAFKEKFDPVWAPKYLATSAGLALPRVLSDIGRLISRGGA